MLQGRQSGRPSVPPGYLPLLGGSPGTTLKGCQRSPAHLRALCPHLLTSTPTSCMEGRGQAACHGSKANWIPSLCRQEPLPPTPKHRTHTHTVKGVHPLQQGGGRMGGVLFCLAPCCCCIPAHVAFNRPCSSVLHPYKA